MAKELRRVDIQYKDPSSTFRAGESVSGNVVLDLSGDFKVKSVRLQLYGLARVSWDESKSYTKGTSSKTSHKNIDVYLDETIVLVSKTETLKGRKSWPFNVRLPAYIPATFEGQHGRVQYYSKLTLERPWKGDVEQIKNFTVIGQLDLNTDAEALKKPSENSGEMMVGLCCKSGPIVGSLTILKRGFVAGQNIPFKAKIENNSRKKLQARVVLNQLSIYRAEGQTRRHNVVLKGLQQGEIEPGEELESNSELKNLPHVAPTHLGGGCKHIDVKYLLTLVAVAGGMDGKDLEVPVEVTIGTVPIRQKEKDPAQMVTPKLKVKAAAKIGSDSPVVGTKVQQGGDKSPRAPLAREM